MVFIDIDKKNCIKGNCNMITKLDTYLGNKNTKIFLLIFMEGCKPCDATRPEWSKIKNVLSNELSKRNDIVVASIDYQLAEKLKNLKNMPHNFPTMRFITNGVSENYEDSNISGNKDRKIDSFIEWIKSKIGELPQKNNQTKSHRNHRNIYKYNQTNKRRQIYRGGKWSRKYKRRINCNRPKGFSQKQYCRYGRK
jgi:hypothetical protein